MTYGQPPVCRRGGCGEPVSERPASCEGDIGWCDTHRGQVREMRYRLTVGVKIRSGAHRSTQPRNNG